MRHEFRFSGFGGQGIIVAGYILGKAASIFWIKHAVQTQSYGPSARGGACKSDVVIADGEISYPRADDPNAFLAFSYEAFKKHKDSVRDGGCLIYDTDLVNPTDEELVPLRERGVSIHAIEAAATARELGNPISSNMVMLGALSAITELVPKDAIVKAVEHSLRDEALKVNLEAVERGFELGKRSQIEAA